jgi:TRAP transporter 4TM/12TM fusion protein
MAEYLNVPYSEVALAALVPSLLFYLGLFIQADLEAARFGISRLPEEMIPGLWATFKSGWLFIVPFVVLIVGMFQLNLLPEEAALDASLVILVVGLFVGYRGKRMSLRKAFEALGKTGVLVLDLMMIGAAAGLIIGILNKSGLGFALTLMLVKIGGGSILLLLMLAAGVCVLLGMGMPTIGVYVLVATLIAPAMVESGIAPMAAHMYVLYFGMLSFITPPVCIAAFAAASIARSDPMATGFAATRFGWSAFVVPFLFLASPSLLLDGPVWDLAHDISTALCGVWLVSVGLVGYLFRKLEMVSRVLFAVAGIALLIPASAFSGGLWTDVAGVVLGGAILVSELRHRRGRLTASPG